MAKDTLQPKKHLIKLRHDKLRKLAKETDRIGLIRAAAESALPAVDWKSFFSEEGHISTPNIQVAIQRVAKTAPKVAAEEIKGFFLTMGYDPLAVRHGVRVKDDKLIIRGSLKDTLDYEFYGTPRGTWPNASRLRKWVRTVVIPSNPYLKNKYAEVRRHRREREGMVRDLTYVIGRSIFKNGLQKKSHWYYENAEELRLAHQANDGGKLLVKYDDRDVNVIGDRYGKGSGSKGWMKGGRMR